MSSDTKTAEDLAHYFRAAAEQRRLLEARQADRRWIAEGKTLLHAVDADVVILFTNPFGNVMHAKRRDHGYGEVFPGDERDNAIGVGRVLANFIFFHLCGQKSPPLLLLSPIDQELHEVFQAVLRKAMLDGIKVREEIDKVQRLTVQIKDIGDEKERVRLLIDAAPALFRFLVGARGPRAEIGRFSRLTDQRRIMSLDWAMKQGLGANEVWQQAFLPAESLTDRARIIGWAHDWFDLIKKEATAKPSALIQDDALMLARLEWINRHLGEDTRLVLITGDHSIRNAARAYFPYSDGRSFVDLWLRHPRSYLTEPEVLSPESKEQAKAETNFTDWLNVFLAKIELDGPDNMLALDKLLADNSKGLVDKSTHALESHPHILDEFKTQWLDYTSRVILAHNCADATEIGDNAQVAELVRTISQQLASVAEVLNKQVSDTWEDMLYTAMNMGWLFSRQPDDWQSRHPPVLFFSTFPAASEVVRDIILVARQQNLTNDFVRDIEALRKEDTSGYTYTLAFGMLLAAQGAWSAAAILAKRAVNIAQENKREDYRITGREAYYLQAVTRRRQIQAPSELADIDGLLVEAEKALKKQREAQAKPDLLEDDYRFDAERVTLHVSYWSFHRFLGAEIPSAVLSLDAIDFRLKELLEKNTFSVSLNRWVARNVGRELLTDLFMVALLKAERGQAFQLDLETFFEQFKLSVEDDKDIPRTFLVNAVYLVTQWWRETEPAKRKKYRDEVLCELRDDQISRYAVMPYDRSRFTYLRNFVEPGGATAPAMT